MLKPACISGVLLALHLLLPLAGASGDRIDRCGEYQLKKEENLTVGFITDLDKRSINVIRIYGPKGKLVKTLADEHLTAHRCADITGDGIPELMLEAYTGGGRNCCRIDAIYSMGPKIENRLVFRSAGGIDFLDGEIIRNLDEEPALEIRASDASLLYLDDLTALDSPSLPLILCYRGGRYVDCTQQFPRLLQQEIQRTEVELREAMKTDTLARQPIPSKVERQGASIRRLALRFYALHILNGEEEEGWHKLQQFVPKDAAVWLTEYQAEIHGKIKRRASVIQHEN